MTIDWVNKFFGFFDARLDFVKKNCLAVIEGTILLTTYLDSLAGYRQGGKSNVKRFADFLEATSGAAETWRKVSVRRIHERLAEVGETDLAEAVRKSYAVDDFSFHNLNHNPDVERGSLLETIGSPYNDRGKEVLESISYENMYSTILWREYRCRAVHETVQPNPSLNFLDKKVPCYTTGTRPNGDGSDRIRFVAFSLPPEFVLATIRNCLAFFRSEWESGSFDYLAMVDRRLKSEP